MALIRSNGGWFHDPSLRAVMYVAPGAYEDNVEPPIAKSLTVVEATQLIPVLEEMGLITPRLDERLRVEDLKITHRLLDLLDAKH